eukprot:CAMPEP_0177644956 /NCGR_PEP_ID=MMETSP0447-20121125/8983_1 /TAXON_ID=0 /ORGANISM="Stygamoeba regulata, Strain BSH-02190019" /LENGTH=310 /DNA_ID=CAMNT_0019147389 /DNA_START=1 /DNA_END=929 /DNA_ORIENTATION=+
MLDLDHIDGVDLLAAGTTSAAIGSDAEDQDAVADQVDELEKQTEHVQQEADDQDGNAPKKLTEVEASRSSLSSTDMCHLPLTNPMESTFSERKYEPRSRVGRDHDDNIADEFSEKDDSTTASSPSSSPVDGTDSSQSTQRVGSESPPLDSTAAILADTLGSAASSTAAAAALASCSSSSSSTTILASSSPSSLSSSSSRSTSSSPTTMGVALNGGESPSSFASLKEARSALDDKLYRKQGLASPTELMLNQRVKELELELRSFREEAATLLSRARTHIQEADESKRAIISLARSQAVDFRERSKARLDEL